MDDLANNIEAPPDDNGMVPPRILHDDNEVPPDVLMNAQDEAESSLPSNNQVPLDLNLKTVPKRKKVQFL